MLDLQNKRVIITGASSGIGRQLAIDLAKYNTQQVLIARNSDKLKCVVDEISLVYPGNFRPLFFVCDVSQQNEVANAIRFTVSQLGGIDILINNAGIGIYGPIKNTTPDDFKRIMDVNFLGAVNCTYHTLPYIQLSKNACIVFISSVASLYGIPMYSSYCSSKAALKSYSQTLRAELGSSNVNILHVSPDYTKTSFFRNEKFIEGASLHRDKMASVEQVAKKITNAIINKRRETIISFRGRILHWFHALFPALVQAYFERRASKLIFRKGKNTNYKKW